MLQADGGRNNSFGPCGRALFSRTDPLLGRKCRKLDEPAVRGSIRFDRIELKRILNTYGRMVVAGEWRDYAIDFRDDAAVFSVFRRAAEIPLYSIEKRPRLKDRQGQYSVVAAGGQVLGRGHDLTAVLRVLERKLLKARRVTAPNAKTKSPGSLRGFSSVFQACLAAVAQTGAAASGTG